MFIAKAFAQAPEAAEIATAAGDLPAEPNPIWSFGYLALFILMIYFLLIRPQQKRFKEHSQMLSGLQKGDKIVTGGGLVGTIDKITEGSDEVVIDLGNKLKVTALKSTITGKNDPRLKPEEKEEKK